MGFFNALLKGLGFEGNQNNEPVKEKEEVTTYKQKTAEYNLNEIETVEEIKTYTPANQENIQEIVELLKQGKTVAVNFELIKNNEFIRALDFMSGAVFALNGKIKKTDNKTFLFYPNLKEGN